MASLLDLDPSQLLALRAHDDASAQAASGAPPAINWDRMQLPPMDPAMQGPRGPSQADAAPAVAVAPPAAQGAMAAPETPSKGFNIGDLLQGGGSIGQDTTHDSEIDPDYGISRGAIRRANNRSMFNSGLLLLAAGAARDDGARASILSNLPNVMDNSNQLQNFSRTRLEVAKAKLATAQAAAQASQDAAWQKSLGDMAAKFGGAQAGQAPAAGAPMPVQPLASATAAPGAVSAPTAPAAAPAPASADVPAAGAAPAGPAPIDLPKPGTVFPDAPAPKLDRPAELAAGWQPKSMADVNLIRGMTRDKAQEWIQQQTAKMQDQEYPGAPYLDPTTKILMQPVYKNGVLSHSTPLGAESTNARIVQDKEGNYRSQKLRADGTVADDSFVEPNSQKQAQKTSDEDAAAISANASSLKARYSPLQNAGQDYARNMQAIKDIDAGKVTTGPASGMINYGRQLFQQFGALGPEGKAALLATTNANSLTKEQAAIFAKANNGSQVTDADVKFAQEINGGGGTDIEIKQALQRRAQNLRNEVNAYNSDVDAHNDAMSAAGMSGGRAVLARVKKVDGNFGTLGDEATPSYATPDAGTKEAPNAPAAISPRDKLKAAMSTGGGGAPVPTIQAPAPAAAPAAGGYTAAQIAAAQAELARRKGAR